jgi:alanyl-tRNA synthetase
VQERLYYDDAYTTEFAGTVERAWSDDEGRTRIVLAGTHFYPTSGGQMHDLGTLGGAAVVDVVEEDGRVVHVVEGLEPPSPGVDLAGVIDPVRRHTHRQQHSGQHVLSRVIEDRLGLATVSSRLGETGNTLDVEISRLALEDLDAIEDEANRIVAEGRAIHIRFLPAEEADAAELRKIPDRQGSLRVIEVEGHDRSACGGTHVRNTAEIGLVAITRVEKVKGGHRIHFLCGDRAMAYRRSRDRLVSRLGVTLTTGEDELEQAVGRLYKEVKAAHKRVAALEREMLLREAEAWIAGAEVIESAGRPVRLVTRTLAADLASAAGDATQALIKTENVVALLFVEGVERVQVLLGRHANLTLDCPTVLRETLQPLGGKGGGQPHYARGSVPGRDVDAVTAAVRRVVLQGRQSS